MARIFLSCGAILGLLSVAFGAFGAHALKKRLSEDLLSVFELGARYQMVHALALLLLGTLMLIKPLGSTGTWAGWSLLAGTIIFSGSLYLLAITGVRGLGAVTPIGGTLLLAGWLLFTISVLSRT